MDRAVGSAENDEFTAIRLDGAGNIVLAGSTKGSMNGGTKLRSDEDIFITKLDPSGVPLWTVQYGSSEAFALDLNDSGNIDLAVLAARATGPRGCTMVASSWCDI
mmetsp:Transcript_40296/g.94398  ORF Transcript_40296/g.94398 Transcript_40296/m.94398 type:complete len:105 (+) Transcript_40296:439-753(+)